MNLALCLGLLLLALSPLAAQACPAGNSDSLAYIRRDNNRCEGLRDRNASSGFDLVSFATTNLGDNYPSNLNIRVPGTGDTRPAVVVQSFDRNYRLDNLNSIQTSDGYSFPLNTRVLQQADVSTQSLRATAYITRDSSPVYFPVVLGQSSSAYEFVIYSPQRSTFPTFEIRQNGKTVYKNPRNTPQQGLIRLTWSYGNAPAGSYELYIVDGEGQRRSFRFEHNSAWF